MENFFYTLSIPLLAVSTGMVYIPFLPDSRCLSITTNVLLKMQCNNSSLMNELGSLLHLFSGFVFRLGDQGF